MKAGSLRRCAFVVTLGLFSCAPPLAKAQQSLSITPFVGETAAEFAARKAGQPRPPAEPEPFSVMLPADAQGHFAVEPVVNGTRIRMVVDTGASVVTLSQQDARSLGISPSPRDFTVKTWTANGVVLVAPILLREVAIGEIVVHDVPAVIVPEDKLQVSLLGMSFLSKLSRFEAGGGKLVLRR